MTEGDDGEDLWAVPPAAGRGPGQAPPTKVPALHAPASMAPARPQRVPRRRNGILAAVVAAVVVVVGLVGLAIASFTMFMQDERTSAVPPAPTATATENSDEPENELPITWEVEATRIVQGTSLAHSWDGQVDSPSIVATPNAWIVGLSQDPSFLQYLAGLDPRTGETLWTYEIDRGGCGIDVVDGVIACLTTQSRVDEFGFASEPFMLARIDAATGAVTESPTTLTSLTSLYHRPEGLLVVGAVGEGAPHAALSLLAPDGSSIWTADIGAAAGAELMFTSYSATGEPTSKDVMDRVRWRDLDGGTAMLWSQPGAMLINLASGPIGGVIDCSRATPAGDALYCMTFDAADASLTTVHRYDRAGVLQWSTPGLRLAYPADSSPARPAALRGNDLIALDLTTGMPGEVLHSFETTGADASSDTVWVEVFGDAARAVVVGKEVDAVALAEGVDEVAWTLPVNRENVWGVMLFADLTVLHMSSEIVGLDSVTGEELWSRAALDGVVDTVAAGDAIAEDTGAGFARRELP